MRVTRRELAEILRKTKKFYTVDFIKRSDRQLRTMNCLNGVSKYTTGGQLNYDPSEHNLINTYSIDSKGYRSIPIENIVGACVEGKTYLVK